MSKHPATCDYTRIGWLKWCCVSVCVLVAWLHTCQESADTSHTCQERVDTLHHMLRECRHVTVRHHVPDCSSVVQTCTAALQIGRLPCCSAGRDTSKLYTPSSIETIDQPWLGTFCVIKDRKDSQKSNNLQPSLDRLESFLCGWREHCTSSRLHLRPVQTRHVFWPWVFWCARTARGGWAGSLLRA